MEYLDTEKRSLFSENNVEKYGCTFLQDGSHLTKLGNHLPGGEEGRLQAEDDTDQEGGFSGFVARLEVNPERCWEDNSVRA